MHAQRRKMLCEELQIQVNVLCDSHSEKVRQAKLASVLNTVIKLMPQRKANRIWKSAFVDLLVNSSYHGVPSVTLNGDSVYINGTFDIQELSKALIWGKQAESIDNREEAI